MEWVGFLVGGAWARMGKAVEGHRIPRRWRVRGGGWWLATDGHRWTQIFKAWEVWLCSPFHGGLGRRPPFAVAHLFAEFCLQVDAFGFAMTARTEVLADGRAPCYRQNVNCWFGGCRWDRGNGCGEAAWTTATGLMELVFIRFYRCDPWLRFLVFNTLGNTNGQD